MIARNREYDVAIVGGGIGGLMAAYEIIKQKPHLKVILFESGKTLTERVCPMVAGKTSKCAKCSPCAIMRGISGAGAFSDGKYNITAEFGGWLGELVGEETTLSYIRKSNSILEEFGASKDVYMPSNELKLECIKHDLHMLQAEVKHLGTDENYQTMLKLFNYINGCVEVLCLTAVEDVDKENHIVYFSGVNGKDQIKASNIIFAVGRSGSEYFSNWCKKNDITMESNQVDIGVRVELPAIIWENFSKNIYEPKVLFRTKGYGDITRMFCFNNRGHVVMENSDGIFSVNGHSFKAVDKKTNNSNFAILSVQKFTQPFQEPIEYAKAIAGLANKISNGNVLVQRFGDLIRGRRTDAKRLKASTTIPTLNAVPGDLSLCMPKRQLDNIIETIYKLNEIAPGTANDDTLLYGVECKYYGARPQMENFELEKTQNIYAIGDGAGVTRSLAQAAANGLMVADTITQGKIFYKNCEL